jgi:hypothetical protein
MYFVITEIENKDKSKKIVVQLARDINNGYIVEKDKIPDYIRYLIFNSCPKIRDQVFFKDFKDIIDKNNNIDEIDKEINYIKEKINEQKSLLKELKKEGKEGKEVEEDLILNEINKLNKQLDNLIKKKIERTKTIGGNPNKKLSEQYSPNYPISASTMPQNIIYYPRQRYNQGYPYQGYNQQMLQYNTSQNNIIQNKAKDQKSKLTFYIEVELELFPGESANIFQKSVVKCQSTFERIREAWADIRGFEYRPAPMNEAYAYNIRNDEQRKQRKQRKQQKKTLKNNIRNNNNKTLKNKSQ